MKYNLFDFDKTIYDGDSTIDFYLYILKSNKSIIKYIPVQVIYFIMYKLKIKSKTSFKEKFYLFFKSINDIEKEVNTFWQINDYKIKDFYKKREHSKDIIISASPYFLLKPICDKLKVKDLIASEVDYKTGKYNGINCKGEEKVVRLKRKYPNIQIKESYSDNYSDLPILKLAEVSFIVKKDVIKKIKITNK